MTIKRTELSSRMSQTVVHGDTIYLAGQVGSGDDVTAQTKDMLSEVDRLLASVGSSKSHILSATIWMADMAQVDDMNTVWDAWIDPANPPARACVESRLVTPEFLVEVMVIAAKA
ncbi:RidA family protein [Litoreibacter albidus]|uniref:Enamine deaminase RidA, house cleaning of reactive enamine intermediates, YjgF/YER057c/UK114 family n=1 Tax=Litoreibacter albidus TaxID=670155 RepID=A0A1H3CLW2_9RHOB|nr:RidA family protein [Litoreibacter albidus]SDX55141.1 Enamine deaminase RidA, house cleaning of reactive enamine intermediates, YjgF/YER057c/UK114 family [Litoreibacter albidus]